MCWILMFLQVEILVRQILIPLFQDFLNASISYVSLECLHKIISCTPFLWYYVNVWEKMQDTWTLKLLINKSNSCRSHKQFKHTNHSIHKTHDAPWENPPNIEDEKYNNPLSMIDNCREWFYNTCRLLGKRYQSSTRE